MGGLPVCDHQSEPLPGGSLGSCLQRYVASLLFFFFLFFWKGLKSKPLFCNLFVAMLENVFSLAGSMQVFLPPDSLASLGEASPTQDNVFCAQLQRFQIKSMNERGLHSWHAENCYKKFPFLCKRSMCSFSLYHQKFFIYV